MINFKNCNNVAILLGSENKWLGSHDEILQNKEGLCYTLCQNQDASDE